MRRAAALLSAAAVCASLAVAVAHPAAAGPPTLSRHVAASGNAPSSFALRGTHPALVRHPVAAPVAPANPRLKAAAVAQRPSRNGTVRVEVTGESGALRTQVRALGGRVLVSAGGVSSVVLAKARLTALAALPGVSSVDPSLRPVEASTSPGPSQGVATSGASAWHTAGKSGDGVKIAVVDDGFGLSSSEYNTAVTAGRLGTNPQLVNEDCTDDNDNPTAFDGDSHGLAVAELASQQAPDAQLYLYCVGSRPAVAAAETNMHNAGVTIATSSLNWFGDARGDGTGAAGSVTDTVRKARQDGILWFNSAGNEIPQHWGGTLADVNHDGLLDLGNHDPGTYPFESDFYYTAASAGGIPTDIGWQFQWDAWPTTANQVTLTAFGVQCTTDFTGDGLDGCNGHQLGSVTMSTSGSSHTPTVGLNTSGFPNTGAFLQIWELTVTLQGAFRAGARYDVYGLGDNGAASDLACPTGDTQGNCIFAAGAKSESILAPADSPYAVAVGAVNSGADGSPSGALEYFSSEGPTIDGRVKPEILGWDGVSSYVPEFSDGFYGTSAASPIAAGSAALVAAANPFMDGAQILNFLEQRAHSGVPNNPPNSAAGYGALTLGAPSGIAAPMGADYQPVSPVRLLDTRSTVGGHHGRVGAGQTVTLSIPSLPSDATAVAVNLTGVGATASTYLSAYPGGTAYPGTSNLNLKPQPDATAAVLAVVTVRNKSITIRNSGGAVDVLVDELGYFGTGAETGRYTALSTPTRVAGNVPLAPRGQLTVSPNLPTGATTAIVNVTTASTTASGYLSAAPTCTGAVSTLNFSQYPRANLAFVRLDGNGHFCVTNGPAAAHVYVDVLGYMSSTGAQYVALPSAQRIVDTRFGNGGNAGGLPSGPLVGGHTTTFYSAGVGVVPAAASALLTGIVEATNDRGGYLAMFPGSTPSSTSTLNYTPNRVVANASLGGLASHTFGLLTNAGSTQAAIDLFGYFLTPSGCPPMTPC